MKFQGNAKLYSSAFIAWAASVVTAGLAYLEGLGDQPINWLAVATFVWASLIQAYKDLVTHRAQSPIASDNTGQVEPSQPTPTTHPMGDSGFKFSPRSLSNMQDIHPDLAKVAKHALKRTPYDFVVTSGKRTKEQQRVLVDTGKSKTMNSRHLTGHALDIAALVDGTVTWDMPYYKAIADVFKQSGDELGVPIEWGGDWTSFVDGSHIQLPKAVYS